MGKKHIFVTSLVMMISLSAMILISYGMFLFMIFYVCARESLTLWSWIIDIFFMVILPTIIPFTNDNRFLTVVILDKNGVTQKLFGFIKLRAISWEEMYEIRLGKYMGGWIFFSKRPINNLFYDDIVKRKDVIQIGYSQKLEAAIKEYTDREIIE